MQRSINNQHDLYSGKPEQNSQPSAGSALMSGGHPLGNDLATRPLSQGDLGGLAQEPSGRSDLQHVDGGAGNRASQVNQTEHIVMNMWNRMKTLESKYIDLADYYKRELVSNSSNRGNAVDGIGGSDLGQPNGGGTSAGAPSQGFPSSTSVNTSKSAVGGVIQQQPAPQQPRSDQIHGRPSPLSTELQTSLAQQLGEGRSSRLLGEDGATIRVDLSEDVIINELRSEKMRFEQVIKSVISGNGAQLNENLPKDHLGPGQLRSSKNQIVLSNEELVRFNMELEGAFKDILEHVDQSQVLAVNNLGQRQTEMFQLATKYRMPSGFKSDAIGVWYDAKTSVTQSISKLKHFIQEKGVALAAQAFRPSSEVQDSSGLKKEDYTQLIQRFEEDMVALKRTTKDFNKSISKIKLAIQAHEDVIEKEKQTVKSDYADLLDAIQSTNEIMAGRGNMVGASTTSSAAQAAQPDIQPRSTRNQLGQQSRGQGGGALVMSPFDKRMSSYQKSALHRSNSRGPTSSGGIQKPPKLAAQHSANARVGRKPSGSGASGAGNLTSPLRGALDQQDQMGRQELEWHPDLGMIKAKLQAYDSSVAELIGEQAAKQDKVEEIMNRVESQVEQALSRFLTTHETDLVKQFFTNTVLTPTETAQIVAKANLQAHSTSNPANAKQLANSSSSNLKRAQTSVSPYRQGQLAGRETGSQYRKTTPTRSKQPKMLGGGASHHAHTPSKELGNGNKFMATGESVKLQELQTNTDQLFGELRRANDKYIEQQVENRRLKDQVQVLSLQIEDLRIHNNRYQMQAQNYQNQMVQQRQKKTRTARGGQVGLSAHEVSGPGPALGEGQRTGQSASSGVHSQDREEVLAEELELCKRIDLFFTAMKLLQRAVNRKEDISQLKVEFETKQRALQKLSKQIQTRVNGQLSGNPQLKKGLLHETSQYQGSSTSQISETMVQNKSVSSLRNRSQSTRAAMPTSSQKTPASSSHRQTTSPLRPRQGSTRPKAPGKLGAVSPKLPRKDGQSSNRAASDKAAAGDYSQNQGAKAQEQADVINAQRQRLLQMDQQLVNARSQLSKLQHSAVAASDERNELQRLVGDYRMALSRVEDLVNDRPDGISQQRLDSLIGLIQSLKQDLNIKEKEIQAAQAQEKGPMDLKDRLRQQINSFEHSLAQKYNQLQKRLEQREAELDAVKRLFVEKLRVLESNFAEIGDHLIANQNEQEKQDQPKTQGQNILEKYLDDANGSREQDDKALEELIQTNSQLHDQVDELKRRFKDFVDPQVHQKLQQDFKGLDEQVRVLAREKQHLVKMFDTLSKERDNAQEEFARAKQEKQLTSVELAKMTQTAQSEKLAREKNDMLIEQSMKEIQLNLKDEIEQKVCFQKEARENDQLAKLLEEENESLQNRLEQREIERVQSKHELEECQTKLKKKEEEIQDHLRDNEDYHELQAKYDKLAETQSALDEDLRKALEAKEELSQALAAAHAEAQAKEDELSGARNEKEDEYLQQLQDREANLAENQDKITSLHTKVEQLTLELDETEQKQSTMVATKDAEIKSLKSSVGTHRDNAVAFEKQFSETQKENKETQRMLRSELDSQTKQVETLKEQLEERAAEFGELHNRLQQEAGDEQQQLMVELAQLKIDRSNMKQKLQSEVDNTALMKRQNWWLTALQLRVKRIVAEKLEKAQLAAQEAKEQLEARENEQQQMITIKDEEIIEHKRSAEQAQQAHAQLQSQFEGVEQEVEGKHAEVQALKEKSDRIEKEKQGILESLGNKLGDQLAEKQAEIEKMKEKMEGMIEEKSTIKTAYDELATEKSQIEQTLEETHLQFSKKQDDLHTEYNEKQLTLQSKLDTHQAQLKQSTGEVEAYKEALEAKESTIQQYEEELMNAQSSSSDAKAIKQQLQSQMDSQKSQLQKQIDEQNEVLESKEQENIAQMKLFSEGKSKLEQEVEKNQQEAIKHQEHAACCQEEAEQLKTEIQALNENIKVRDEEIDQLEAQLKELEQEKEQQNEGQDEILQQVLQLEDTKEQNDKTIKKQQQEIKNYAELLNEQEEKLAELEVHEANCKEFEQKLKASKEYSQSLEQNQATQSSENDGELEKLNSIIQIIQNEKEQMNEKIEDLQENLTQTEGQIQEYYQQNTDLQSQLESAEKSHEQCKTKLDQAEQTLEQHYKEKGNIFKDLDAMKVESAKQKEACEKLNKQIAEKDLQITGLEEDLALSAQKLEKANGKLENANEQICKHEESEQGYKVKLDQVHTDMSSKVDSEHDNVKKIVDIHKTNEELSQQLLNKVEQNKQLEGNVKSLEISSKKQAEEASQKQQELQDELENQKTAYEAMMDQLAMYQETEQKLAESDSQMKDLLIKYQKVEIEKQDLEERLEDLDRNGKNDMSRKSIGSEEEYGSVQEMKDHLKHARQILSNFMQKLPYSAAENEATLPVMYSMFEFTKDEQERLHQARLSFNQDKMSAEVKDKSKKLFGGLFKGKKGTKTDGSLNSGGGNTNNTNTSQGNK